MKLCCKCKTKKQDSEFYANKRMKDGLNTFCKECHKEHGREAKRVKRRDSEFKAAEAVKKKAYRAANSDAHKDYMKAWHIKNSEAQREYRAKYHSDNEEYFLIYRSANKTRRNAITKKRQASLIKRSPAWLDAVDNFEIDCIYAYCGALRSIGLKYEVDHVIPLQGKNVSGLHVPSNLQVISEFENRSKANRMEI